jgi:cytochrome c oxidase subunit 4
MKKEGTHISSYTSHAVVLIALLSLTAVSVIITGWHIGAFTVAIALIIASIKVSTVIYNFMHVKHESRFIKLMVLGVFFVYTLVIVITFIDYYLR